MEKIKHFVYIDESGVHKTSAHSSFALVYVQIHNKNIVQNEIINIEKSVVRIYNDNPQELISKLFDLIIKKNINIHS